MTKKKVKFMCTAFRDGFQSVYGARVFTEDFLPAVEIIEVGMNAADFDLVDADSPFDSSLIHYSRA